MMYTRIGKKRLAKHALHNSALILCAGLCILGSSASAYAKVTFTKGRSATKWFATIAMMAALFCSTGSWAAAAPPHGTVQANNVNDPVNHPFMETASNSNCSGGVCSITFPGISATATLIQHVSCNVTGSGSIVVTGAFVYTNNTQVPNYLPVNAPVVFGGNSYYVMNDDTYLFLGSGEALVVEIISSGTP